MDSFGSGSGIPDDEDELTRPRIARPGPSSSAPPLTLRGVGAPANPSPTTQRRIGDETEGNRLGTTGSGISQIQHGSPEGGIGIAKPHPILGGILRGLNTVGSIAGAVSPLAHNIMTAIPGTEEHHSSLLGQQRGRIGEDVAQEKEEAQIGQAQAGTAHTQAETGAIPSTIAHTEAETNKLQHPEPKEEAEGKTVTTDEGIFQWDPKTRSYGIRVGDAPGKQETAGKTITTDKGVMQWDPETKKYDIRAGGAPVKDKPEPGSFMPLYDEKGHVSGAWDPKSGRVVKTPEGALPGNTAQGHGIQEKATTAATKEAQPYQKMIDDASQAHELADMAGKGNASADVDLVLSFFKMMRGTGGANIRFTQQEQNLILGARSAGQGLMAIGQKVVGEGQPLTPEQRQNMVAVIDMHAKAAQQHLEQMQHGQGQGSGAEPVYATNPKTKERVVSTDGGKTWQPAK